MSRATPILGFKPPYFRGSEILVPIVTGTCDGGVLSATPTMWARIIREIALLQEPVPGARATIRKPSGRLL